MQSLKNKGQDEHSPNPEELVQVRKIPEKLVPPSDDIKSFLLPIRVLNHESGQKTIDRASVPSNPSLL